MKGVHLPWAIVALAGTPLLGQKSTWSEPVAVTTGENAFAVPWEMHAVGKTLLVVCLEMAGGAREPTTVSLHRSPDEGRTWDRVATVEVGKMDGPPPVLVGRGRVAMIRSSRSEKSILLTLDWATGAELARHEIDLDLGRGVWPTLIAHGDSLYAAGAGQQHRVALHRSDDAGKTWTPVELPEEQVVSESKVLMMARGKALRLFFGQQTDGRSTIRHIVSEDGGKTWRDGEGEFSPAGQSAQPLDIVSTPGSALLLYARYDDRDRAGLFVARSVDGERTWSSSESAATIRLREATTFTRLRAGVTGALICGLEGQFPKEGRSFVLRSTDSGKTWRNTDFDADLERVNVFCVGCLCGADEACIAWTNVESLKALQDGGGRPNVMFRRSTPPSVERDK